MFPLGKRGALLPRQPGTAAGHGRAWCDGVLCSVAAICLQVFGLVKSPPDAIAGCEKAC